MALKFIESEGIWYTCSRGGKLQKPVRLPSDASPVIYLTPIPRFVVGVSGQRYHVKPNMILIDVKAQDARSWIAAGQARKPSTHELVRLNGHLAIDQ